MNEQEYFLGLDMGTGSVGWAVTDTDYNLIKINRKKAWGSVLFETSEGAKKRRVNRCARRRLKRQKERLSLLRELFEEEMQKVDKGFFLRMKESRYVYKDKRDENGEKPQLPYALFVDENYTDVDYHRDFPTIYHLRRDLIQEENKEFDIRLVYLAIAHILKNRGHFFANMGSEDVNLDFKESFKDLLKCWNDLMADDEARIRVEEKSLADIEEKLKDTKTVKSKKKQEIIDVIGNSDKKFNELVSLIVGGKVSLSKLFGRGEYESLDINKICFDEASYEENEEYYIANLDDYYDIIARAKVIYDWRILSSILKGDETGLISAAKVKDYEKHKEDLKILKKAILEDGIGTKEERKKLYKKVFGVPQKNENNYSSYVGLVSTNGQKRVIKNKKCIRADFYKFIKSSVLPELKEGDRKNYIEKEMELEEFMPKARVKENSVVPYQVHEKELKKILCNAEKYLPFLKNTDETGKSVSDKIRMLMTFRIPYYVGPLLGNNAWVEREALGKVTPWNFEEKVNVEKSAEKFIEKMTSKCTYLKNEDVLPMSSLIYEKYMVLNEINKLKIYSEPISVALKQDIYRDLFERKQKVTVKKLIDYLKAEKGYADLKREDISGIDVEIKSSLKSYHAFKEKFTQEALSEKEKEDIIKDMTLFGAEPKLLKKRLTAKYPDYENQISSLIKSFKCNDWGRLSYKLLNGIAVDVPGQGEIGTVMYRLWNTNDNFMQIIESGDSLYAKLIKEENGEVKKNGIEYSMVDDLYVSPAVKRQIWKALQVTDEIMGAMGKAPKRIFVEMARERAEKKRSVTRKDRLKELYKSIKDEKVLYDKLCDTDNDALRSDKLYLYYTQLGRCAYTGRRIEIDELFDNNIYDVDHIYPRSKTADDSMDNRVLVYKPVNENKNDIYPIDGEIQKNMKADWSIWKQKGLISEEKYKRLIRITELTNDELAGFINRQLIETRQSTKAFIEVLRSIIPEETEIVYSKASNVSRFRQRYGLLKVRDINDLHHAKDAYLNIVVGNVYHLKFTKDVRKYFNENGTYRTYNLYKMFDYNVNYGSETAWETGDSGTIMKVKHNMKCDRILVTRQTYEKGGVLFNVQPLKKGQGQVPLKSGKGNERLKDIALYGGYNSASIAYFMLIEGKNKKDKQCKYIVPVPLYLKEKMKTDENFAKEHFAKEYKLKDVRLVRKILIQTLMITNGFKMRIAGKSDTRLIVHNANQLELNPKYYKTMRELGKFILDRKEKKDIAINKNSGITDEILLDIYYMFKEKLEDSVYKEMLGNFSNIMDKGIDKFKKLSLDEKVVQIYELTSLFKCTSEMPDLSRIGGSKNTSAIRISMDVTKREKLAIIHQSVTGIYEKIERINE